MLKLFSNLNQMCLIYILKLMDDLRDDEYLNKIRSKIDDTRTFPKSYYGTASSKSDSGTGKSLLICLFI